MTDSSDVLAHLADAIEGGELRPFYQPQVCAKTGRLVGVEALARWPHREAGFVSPGLFVPYAEQNGLINMLGTAMLRRACCDAVAWPHLSVAVNVSPLQFASGALIDIVTDALSASGLPSSRLELEITEGIVFADPERAMETMKALRTLGVRLALDDFGTGFASLSYLRTLPWDKVKIDQSFVREASFVTSAAIIHAVIALSRALGLKVTAEGVETEEQRSFLRTAGCHVLQGYLFGQAVDAAAVTARLSEAFEPPGARLG